MSEAFVRPSITRLELLPLLPSCLSKAQVTLVLGSRAEELTTCELLRVAIVEWLITSRALAATDQNAAGLLVLQEFADAIKQVADDFDRLAAESECVGHLAILAVMDYRYVQLLPADRRFYDPSESVWLEALPHSALTIISCDLTVLLLRFFARIRKMQAQETAENGSQKTSGKPTDTA